MLRQLEKQSELIFRVQKIFITNLDSTQVNPIKSSLNYSVTFFICMSQYLRSQTSQKAPELAHIGVKLRILLLRMV